ncbi:conserved Plasmodium protein, unknown function [Plasmodium ovale]|uniref:Uncharacterized protein n=2 Tax=Plasmodium ovale TaxID=36330 RepID=A0A1D3TJW1_PLAOA|nr:conserved Plasmodium protein, unknown function [Plasmodium ovale]
MKEQCYIIPGEFGVLVQVFIGFVSLCILLTKYLLENPRRTFIKFLKDVIVILCGSITLHFANLILCICIFRYHVLPYLCKIEMDECSIYFIQIIIDATLGLYLQYKLLSFFKFLKFRREYLRKNSTSSIYKPIDAFSHYISFIKYVNSHNKDKQPDVNNSTGSVDNNSYNKNNKNNKSSFFKTNYFNVNGNTGKKENHDNISNNSSESKNVKAQNSDNSTDFFDDNIYKDKQVYKSDKGLHNLATSAKGGGEKADNTNGKHAKKIYTDKDLGKCNKSDKYGKYDKYGDNNRENYKNELKLLTDDPQNEEVRIQLNENGPLGNDDVIIYENNNIDMYKQIEEKYVDMNLFQSIFLWIFVLLTVKFISLVLFFLLSPIFNAFVLNTIAHIADMRYKLLVVMIIVPFFFNFIIYYFTDSIIKTSGAYKGGNND